MWTAKQVADYTQVSVRTIYRMKDRGELPYYQTGRCIRFKQEEVDEALKGGEKECQKRQNEAPKQPRI